MKTIKTLKAAIHLLFFGLITVFFAQLLFWCTVYFFSDALPPLLQNFKMIFNPVFFNWQTLIDPFTNALNFVLFIVAVYYLKKSIASFVNSDFYNASVIVNLKKAGNIFVFIGVSTILIQFLSGIYILNITQNIVKINSLFALSSLIITAFDLKSIFLIIAGLFLLLFSASFMIARKLKQENDLTI
jgi:hypothetical protein